MKANFPQFLWIWNKTQKLPMPDIHKKMVFWLSNAHRDKAKKLLLLLFRGAGKSSIMAIYCAWLLYRNPNARILILAAEENLASKLSGNLLKIIERHPCTSPLINRVGKKWAAGEFTVVRDAVMRDPSVVARGLHGNITGYRADYILCDDVEVPNTCDTQIKRRDLRNKLEELNFIIVPGGSIIYIGTPHSSESIYLNKAELSQGSTPYLENFERLFIPVLDSQGKSAWPERFDLATINQMRNSIGPRTFEAQMMLAPSPVEDARLNLNSIKWYSVGSHEYSARASDVTDFCEKNIIRECCFWDPSYGHPERGDGCVLVLVYLDREGNYWLHDVEYVSFTIGTDDQDEITQLCESAIMFLDRNNISQVYVENNGLGQFIPSTLRKNIQQKKSNIKVIAHRSHKSKTQRILSSLDPILASGSLHINVSLTGSRIYQELKEWQPISSYQDDGVDALASCISIIPPISLGSWLPGPVLSECDFEIIQ